MNARLTQAPDRGPDPLPAPDRRAALDRSPARSGWQAQAIGALTLALAFALVVATWLLLRPLLLIAASFVIAQALTPLICWLERRLPRLGAIIAVYLVALSFIGGLFWLTVPVLVDQLEELARRGPELLDRVQAWVEQREALTGLPIGEDKVANAVDASSNQVARGLLSVPLKIGEVGTEVVVVVVMSSYWLVAAPALRRFVLSLIPAHRREQANEMLAEMGHTVGGYFRATVLNALIVGAVTYLALRIIGVDYALVLALLAGLAEFVPVAGPILATVAAVAVALLDSPGQALLIGTFYLVFQQFSSNLLLPHIVRQQTDIPPLLTLAALLLGSTLAGILGAILAIPLAGVIRVFILRVAAPAARRLAGVDDLDVIRS
ncbi:MAG TPA: AI-2E family transporter, partial [Dehalococcoidia bacterium]|nr:AI-2E family transporter [Dehalococcoidia bacterium]